MPKKFRRWRSRLIGRSHTPLSPIKTKVYVQCETKRHQFPNTNYLVFVPELIQSTVSCQLHVRKALWPFAPGGANWNGAFKDIIRSCDWERMVGPQGPKCLRISSTFLNKIFSYDVLKLWSRQRSLSVTQQYLASWPSLPTAATISCSYQNK